MSAILAASPVALSPADFDFLAGLLKQRSGLSITADKGYLVDTRLQPVAKANGFVGIRELVAALRNNPPQALVYQVTEAMTTNESMFFRDTKPFEHLSKVILPAFKAAGKNNIRIWSAACSTGQEPYSIAMTLKEEAAKYPGLLAEIYATDLADKVIERARSGLYSQFEVQRGLPITMLMKYFEQRPGNMWQLKDTIRSMVKYAPANLLQPYGALGRFDIIFCRNVLIYFDEKTKSDVLDRMAAITNKSGFLFLGGAESVLGLTTKYKLMEPHRGLYTLV